VVRLSVRLTPRAGSDVVDGVVDGVLRVRVAAAPAEDAANRALLRLVARELGIPPSEVRLVSGARGRDKVVAVQAEPRAVTARWPGLRV
jgi:uncharacterized protein YggU (UPF0235/DUF167 family)